jgi:predicted AAA+ superfamily ATPase
MSTLFDTLYTIHQAVLDSTTMQIRRYLFDQVHWEAQAICIQGDRGVGKTTLLCQYLLEQYDGDPNQALYLSADNINVLSNGLFAIAQQYFAMGGKALFIDEVHKYPNWSIELKNIIDTYKKHPIVFSGSSSLDLQHSKADLSRRVVYYRLWGLSFREYLHLKLGKVFPVYTLEEILKSHTQIARQFASMTILKHFNDYLAYGYYPFFMEGEKDYLHKINNVIEKVIFEDIAVVYHLKQETLVTLKKLLWLISTTQTLTPNIDNISQSYGVSRAMIYNCFEYLDRAGLIQCLHTQGKGLKLTRKPAKIYFNNTNLIYAINATLPSDSFIGAVRETFFTNQLSKNHAIKLHKRADFILDQRYVIEVGGRNKTAAQIQAMDQAYLAIDGMEIGSFNRVPLYLFGFLY